MTNQSDFEWAGRAHMMVDIETLSTRRDAHIMCVALVPFFPEGDANLFNEGVEGLRPEVWGLHPDAQPERHIDPHTISWWLSQSNEAQTIVNGLWTGADGILSLDNCYDFCTSIAEKMAFVKPKRVWANSPTFDLVILRHLFEICDVEVPWTYRQERDVRTAAEGALGYCGPGDLLRGVAHDPAYDCMAQAYTVQAFYKTRLTEEGIH